MDFYDINDKSIHVSFQQAVLAGINQKTGGVFMPSEIKHLHSSMIYRNPPLSFREITFKIARMFFGNEINDSDLMQIVAQFYPHRIPINPISPTSYVLELFHGNTCNYKDIGTSFSAYLFEYLNRNKNEPINLIVASFGEYACSIANSISQVKGVNVIILYPKNSLTEIQKRILSASAHNVHCIAVDGDISACELIVNKALSDQEFIEHLKLKLNNDKPLIPYGDTSVAPLIPQIAFFVYASLSVLYRCGYDNKIEHPEIIASVPSGSFSSLLSGLIAKKMGVPIHSFISVENKNNTPEKNHLDKNINKNTIEIIDTKTLSSSNNLNFKRICELYSPEELKSIVTTYLLDYNSVIDAVSDCNNKTGYIIDPYGGMAWRAWQDTYIKKQQDNLVGIILQTSHPAKFYDLMKKAIGRPPSLPDRLESIQCTDSRQMEISAKYSDFRELLSNINI